MNAGRRVAVTGMGGVCGLGARWSDVATGLRGGRSGITTWPPLAEVEGVRTRLAGPCEEPALPDDTPRKKLRSMGRVSRLATWTTREALRQAELLEHPCLRDGTTGVAFGSTTGSPPDMIAFGHVMGHERRTRGLTPMHYLRLMSHTCAANLGQFFEVTGLVMPTASACTSASQALGFGFEQIRMGKQEVMLCGGAEELHEIEVGVFDMMFATSTREGDPPATPRPFDVQRDGLVVAEGSATLVLEAWEHAEARGAEILAEVLGYASTCDGAHLTAPDSAGMEAAMRGALGDAGLPADAVDYVNAHATATEAGDVAESQAMARVYGADVPVSSIKGHLGHSLGACGGLEAWACVGMLREGWLAPTLHLDEVDPACAGLDYVQGAPREATPKVIATNNSAFGGLNTSLLLGRVP